MPTDTDHADAIISDGSDRSRSVSSVAVLIHRIGVVIAKIVTVIVIDKAVVVVVDAVAWYLSRIYPDIAHKVFVSVIEAGIDVGDDDRGAARRQVPSCGSRDLCHSPKVLIGPQRIVRYCLQAV